MTDSPADEVQNEDTTKEQAQGRVVPEKAIAEVRAKKRAAEDAAEAATAAVAAKDKEIAELKARLAGQSQGIDVETLRSMITETIDQRLAPIENRDVQNTLGVTAEQFAAIQAVQQAYPGMKADKAMILARSEKPELFSPPPRGYQPDKHRTLPPSVASPMRTAPNTQTKPLQQRFDEARADGGQEAAEQVAREEAARLVLQHRRARMGL